MKKPAIPSNVGDPTIDAIKKNLDIITGRSGGEIAPLSASASLSDATSKINEIIARLNAST